MSRVYFNEYNVLMESAAYLPLASGILRASAEANPKLAGHYEFMPFLFLRDRPEVLLDRYENPAVAAFSASMWNEQLNLELARRIKERYPDCLIVFGGPQVPHDPAGYFAQHPFIGVTIRGEGERAFSAVLDRFIGSRDFAGLPSVSFRDPLSGLCVRNDGEYGLEKNLDTYPSPYLEGLYEYLFEEFPDIDFQAIVETNRGCPFKCAFCFWGHGGLSAKFRFHGIARIEREIRWCAEHKIRYVFNADSNFGMHKRDREIAQILVETKREFGYPEKFRTCFGKNTDERIFEIGELLNSEGMEKGITLSRQSMDPQVLENIDRKNIKIETFRNLQLRFNESRIPVYTELILGLAGETCESWIEGIDTVLSSGLKNQLFVYMCQVFPNTTMASAGHIERYGIQTSQIRLSEIHGTIRDADDVAEYEDIVVGSKAMPTRDWRKAARFSWMTMALHSLKAGFFVLMYLNDRHGVRYRDIISCLSEARMPEGIGAILRRETAEMERVLNRIVSGGERACELREFGDIYWDVEEAMLFRICEDLDGFYAELEEVVAAFLRESAIDFDPRELRQAILYQRVRMPHWEAKGEVRADFDWNFPEYFECGARGEAIPLEPIRQTLHVPSPRRYGGDKRAFAREVVLWGRKSDLLLEAVTWDGPKTAPVTA